VYKDNLKKLLEKVRSGEISVDDAVTSFRGFPYEDINFARVDTHRALRTGIPEVIYSEGKTESQVRDIAMSLHKSGTIVLATRATPALYGSLKPGFSDIAWHEQARIISIGQFPEPSSRGEILIVTAGTTDIPVAEEAGLTARAMGHRVKYVYDAGIAGVHRLFDCINTIRSAEVIIAVAGMEGALPTFLAGLVERPVIAVPTSVGYGASFRGLAALLTMLNSCAPGVGVVNIDNGFGAGCLAAMINRGK